MNKHRRRWLWQAPLGLALVGFGASLVSEAGNWKAQGAETAEWVLLGVLALVLLNGGLSVFGNSILERVRYERYRERDV